MKIDLPERQGSRPETTNTNPHEQLSQNPEMEIHQQFKSRVFNFEGVTRQASIISVPGAEALWLDEEQTCNCKNGYIIGREFAHVHPAYDVSMHMALSEVDFNEVIEKKWGEKHPLAGLGPIPETIAMVYAPRDEDEINIVLNIVQASWKNARNQ